MALVALCVYGGLSSFYSTVLPGSITSLTVASWPDNPVTAIFVTTQGPSRPQLFDPISGCLYYTEDDYVIITGYRGPSIDIVIPSTIDGKKVTSIEGHPYGDVLYYGFGSDIISITISDGITILGDKIFQSCYDLKNISIPGSVTSIGPGTLLIYRASFSVTCPHDSYAHHFSADRHIDVLFSDPPPTDGGVGNEGLPITPLLWIGSTLLAIIVAISIFFTKRKRGA